MEDSRQIALAYYKLSPENIQQEVHNFFTEMDPAGTDQVSRQDFLEYINRHDDCPHLSNRSFFDLLKTEGSEELDFMAVITLFYIIYSGRPFCKGHCTNFIQGSYFTCVECYDHCTDTFDVCAACFLDGKYDHRHKKFLDNFVLFQARRSNRREGEGFGLNLKRADSGIINQSKAPEYAQPNYLEEKPESDSGRNKPTTPQKRNSSPPKQLTVEPSSSIPSAKEGSNISTSNAIVPAKTKNKPGKTAIKAAELALVLGNIFVTGATSQCTIL